ncbi:Monothiol glutaredoxin-3 [Fulvia fulva]|uniref:Monothiol glutaredoxin-3 n=1 Tax=Passalora fulva TaxID=5499 RepID=A0A9Q8P4Q6_PASFU|nr:Monothiol glutaredoxin-3 [Fulvia fulva]KAK4635163.1 Monothiol glutaredoxin-3 [Fulvia fulva]KAK4637335.1 Monothiol glutaredoxin-3 [Fulvia fulva]UJO12977.1 Monothiol glutaredoxin-3 [Fulvia fulva]WPV08304.1 Monothiol glutaredoxin-3 [Fulvia fulva]WPV24930.1 Monothiol glutaredoxin-3 [Fulvia fulva]
MSGKSTALPAHSSSSHARATTNSHAGPTCTLQPVASEADFDATVAALPPSTLAIVYFNADWAEPCQKITLVLSTLAATYEQTSPPRIAFFSIDAEELSDISEKYNVTQVPFIALQKGGKILETIIGLDVNHIRSTIDRYAGGGAGGESLPPAQKVNKSEQPQTNGGGVAKYAPGASDPSTAPQYSAEQMDAPKSKEELDQRLSELVKAAPVMLFMKGTPSAPQCGFSRQTVSILREKGVRYGFFNILADDEVRQGLKEFSEWPTFPQVYVDGELVGGLDILKEEFENDPEFLKDYSVQKQAQAA